MENGGNDVYFLSHLESLYRFYTELKTAERVSQVRLPSPVDRLKELADTRPNMGISKAIGQRSAVRESGRRVQQEIISPTTGSRQQQPPPQQQYAQQQYPQSPYSPAYQQPYQQPYPAYPPPVIIMPQQPQAPPQRSRVDPNGYLERLLSLKDDENRRLVQLLASKERSPSSQPPPPTAASLRSSQPGAPQLSPDRVYGMQPIAEDLLPEERVLISLEKEELDELRLLSSLPEDLQKIKFETVKNMSELRTQLEKELHQQRRDRMKYQMQQQAKEEARMFENELWVDQQRKNALSQRLSDEALLQ